MQFNCPTCNSRHSLDTVVEEEAARKMMGLLAGLDADFGMATASYLSLFRPKKQALRWTRAYALAKTVKALAEQHGFEVLAASMIETVASMSEKRATPHWKYLTTHNYLKSVMETVKARGVIQSAPAQALTTQMASVTPLKGRSSKTALSMQALQEED